MLHAVFWRTGVVPGLICGTGILAGAVVKGHGQDGRATKPEPNRVTTRPRAA
ncbi:MAG TPA: hypothetical protein VFQ24_01410 [Terriglobia bacterium]|nr:hypothetical protein [Terriglobia bacterium]